MIVNIYLILSKFQADIISFNPYRHGMGQVLHFLADEEVPEES